MSARLISRCGEIRLDVELGAEATLGRGKKNSVVLKPELLSSRHARIWHDSAHGCYMLEDLGSSNGTRLDGVAVRRKEPLGHLHVITLAEHYDFIFVDAVQGRVRHSGQGLGAGPLAEAVAKEVSEQSEVTLFESLPLPLPGGFDEESETDRREKTIMEELPLPLPGFLRPDEEEESPGPPPTVQAGEQDMDQLKAALTEAKDGKPSAAGAAGPVDRGSSSGFRPTIPPRPTESDVADLLAEADAVDAEALQNPADAGSSPVASRSFDDTFFLEIRTEEGIVRHRLKEGDNLVGRDPRADIRPTSPEVSRRHALFTASTGRLTVQDLGSRNQTFVAGRPISKPVELRPGTEMRFGALEARVSDVDGWEDPS